MRHAGVTELLLGNSEWGTSTRLCPRPLTVIGYKRRTGGMKNGLLLAASYPAHPQ